MRRFVCDSHAGRFVFQKSDRAVWSVYVYLHCRSRHRFNRSDSVRYLGNRSGQPLSVVQDNVGQQLGPYDDFFAALVVDQAQFSKLVHEMSDARPCGADHFS